MTSSTSDDNSVLLIHAYLDGELDPANALEIAQRMRTDPALAAEGRRVTALQQLIHERLPREVAPSGLQARIEASVGGQRRARERVRRFRCQEVREERDRGGIARRPDRSPKGGVEGPSLRHLRLIVETRRARGDYAGLSPLIVTR